MAIVIEQVTYDYQMPSGGAPGGKGKKRKAGAQQEVAVRETALSGVSLTVQEGEFLGIIGHTGSGKSTLVQLMNGLLLPSAGSVFKRPEGYFAGALIEQAGLKGAQIGGAQVSEKHAGFIVNIGNATAGDVLTLIERVQKTVFEHSGVHLETEVRVIGEE